MGILTLTQATVGKRPIYREVDGLSWIDTDGLSQSMSSVETLDLSLTDELTVVWVGRKLSDAATAVALEFGVNSTTTTGTFALRAPSGAGSPNYWAVAHGSPVASAFSTGASTFAAPVSSVVGFRAKISTDQRSMWVDGVQVSSSAIDLGSRNFGNRSIFFAARNNNTFFFNGRTMALFILGRRLEDADMIHVMQIMSTYLNSWR